MCLGSTTEAVTLNSTLEALTFGDADDVNRLPVLKQAGIKLCTQLYLLCSSAILQSNFAQYFERTKLRSWTALAVFLNLEQLLNLLVRLLTCRCCLCFSLSCLAILFGFSALLLLIVL